MGVVFFFTLLSAICYLSGPQNKNALKLNLSSKIMRFVPRGRCDKGTPKEAPEEPWRGAGSPVPGCSPHSGGFPPAVGGWEAGAGAGPCPAGGWCSGCLQATRERLCGKRLLLLIKQHRSIPAHQSDGGKPFSRLGCWN